MERFEENVATDGRRLAEGLLFLVLFCLMVPLADYLSMYVGHSCDPNGPCKIPVGPGLFATTGALPIGAAFVLRDFVQRRFGLLISACTVVMGAALAGYLAPPSLVVASGVAMLIAGFVDLAVYTVLSRWNFVYAVAISCVVSAAVDSTIFLWLAFASLDLVAGQTLAKVWVVLAALPFAHWLWKRDLRIGLAAA
ncbi:MAG TPA: VUT family protein [Xanthobacteraceae bacterium]|nr:VUT family protein [Xanthobacteraceae bacterium]